MMLALDDTIAAVATAAGAAARGVVRISGSRAIACLRGFFAPKSGWPTERFSLPRTLGGELPGVHRLPCEAYVWPSRRSYTREPTAELHFVGAPPLVDAVLRSACANGARLARPGEFTLRAFLAGRLDLVQAEAVLGVIDAYDRQQLTIALDQLAGGLSGPLARLRGDLLDLLADLEAGLDFVEEDITFVTAGELARRLTAAQECLGSISGSLSARTRSASQPAVVLVGWPNTGKSSLFNALVSREQALVSAQAGTTRDYLCATVDLGGIVCRLIDTAGIEPGAGRATIDAAAQRLGDQQREHADVQLLCIDCSRPLNDVEREWLEQSGDALVVLTKCDRPRKVAVSQSHVATSAMSGSGLTELRRAIAARVSARPGAACAVASTAARCRESVELAAASLSRARHFAEQKRGDELAAAEIRIALDEIGKVTGAVYTDDVLDRIFSRFCIGK